MSYPTEKEIIDAKAVLHAEVARNARKEKEMLDRHFEEYKFWCSEGCGFVDRNHRCEQWGTLTHIPPKAIEAIRKVSA